MRKNKLFMLATLVTVLGLVAAAALAVGRSTPVVSMPADADMMMPPANIPLNPAWKAQPGGAAVNLPWTNVRVSNDGSSETKNEPFVAVDPHNAQHLVVGANTWQAGNGNYSVIAYTSFDGGQTWQSSNPYFNLNASRLNAADATVAFGADGSVYFAFVAVSPAEGAVPVSRSKDGGLTWSSQNWATGFTGMGADKPLLAVGNGKLYLYYQNGAGLYGRTSTDGATWSTATTLDSAGRYAAPVVDSHGNVNVFYVANNTIKLARQAAGADGYVISTVSTATPLQPRQTHYRAAIYPAAGVDAAGNLTVAWADGRNAGRGNDVLTSRSVDGGHTWSSPASASHDSGSADQLMPSVAVGANGAVNILYLDTRNDAKNVNYDMYLSQAADGVHFGSDVRVSNVSSNPNNDPRQQGSFIGDFNSVAVANGVANVVWGDTRDNVLNIYLARVNTGIDGSK